jgi:membrane-associated phospholipid phosphatase
MIGAMTDSETRGMGPASSAATPASPAPRLRGRAALLLCVLASLAFGALAADLLLHGPITAVDPAISLWFHDHGRAPFTVAMRAVTGLHATATVLGLCAVAATLLVLNGERAWVLPLVAAVPGGMVLNVLVKNSFQRPRPSFDHPLLTLTTYSFPSGHTSAATLAWGFALVWLFAHRGPGRERLLGSTIALFMVAMTALSRVYLGAHYVSDVLAASAEGAAWLALCFLVLTPVVWRRAR